MILIHPLLLSEERLNLDEESLLLLAQPVQLGLDPLALPLHTLLPLMALLSLLVLGI
jgi:hypothetical protein